MASEALLRGAGVLVWSTDSSGQLLILLGRERFTPGWKAGSNRWMTFSGKIQRPGESAAACAAREFMEETLGVVPLCAETENLAQHLGALGNEHRCEYQVQMKNNIFGRHEHFLCRAAYEDYPQRFAALYRQLRNLDHLSRLCRRSYQLLPHTLRFLTIGGQFVSGFLVTSLHLHRFVATVMVLDTSTNQTYTQCVQLSTEETQQLAYYEKSWYRLRHVFLSLKPEIRQHPAVCAKYSGPFLIDVWVNRDCLEKTELKWWPASMIHQILQSEDLLFHAFFQLLFPRLLERLLAVAQDDCQTEVPEWRAMVKKKTSFDSPTWLPCLEEKRKECLIDEQESAEASSAEAGPQEYQTASLAPHRG